MMMIALSGSDNDLDDDLQQAELAQGQISELFHLRYVCHGSLYPLRYPHCPTETSWQPQLPLCIHSD